MPEYDIALELARLHIRDKTYCGEPALPNTVPTKICEIKKSRLVGGFLNGAGSIRAYPHAENTGLVISDTAKIGSFSITSKLLALFFSNYNLFSSIISRNLWATVTILSKGLRVLEV